MFTLPPLPYPYEALAPTVSANTLHFHHDKHHATYVKTLNQLLGDAGGSPSSLEDVIRSSAQSGKNKLFNNAAQAWNHAYFWESMSPDGEKPGGEFLAAVNATFGGVDALREAFVKTGAEHFGSGWVWLATDDDGATLKIFATHDAHDTVTDSGVTPLLVCDLWEHAYYLDYQNDRKRYLESWFDAVANWRFATAQLAAAKSKADVWHYPAPDLQTQAA
jgi:Fe-Mn family superoxide dismutase